MRRLLLLLLSITGPVIGQVVAVLPGQTVSGAGNALVVPDGTLVSVSPTGQVVATNNAIRYQGSGHLLNAGFLSSATTDTVFATGRLDATNVGLITGPPGFFGVIRAREGVIVNHGTIRGSIGIFLEGPGNFTDRVDGLIFNYGTIDSQSGFGANSGLGGRFVNLGTVRFSTGVGMAGTDGLLENHGTITGSGVTGINAGNGSTIINTGSIVVTGRGVQNFGVGPARGMTLVNSGRLVATTDAFFGSAFADLVELRTGSTVVGTLDGQGNADGDDVLRLVGAGSLGSAVVNFERLQVGGFWSISGNVAIGTAVDVNAGRLAADGTLTTPLVRVHRGASLGGTGTVAGAVDVLPGGAIGPGNSIGTLTVNGNVSFAAGSTFAVELDGRPGLRADRLDVVGGANVVSIAPGAVLRPLLGVGSYRHGDRYTVLTTAGATGIQGAFAVLPASAAIGLRPIQTGSSLVLEVVRTPYASLATSDNRRAIAVALDLVIDSAGGDLRELLDQLDRLESGEFQSALTMLEPEFYDVYREVGLAAHRDVAAAAAARLGHRTAGPEGESDLMADGGSHDLPGFRLWGGAEGTFAERDADRDVTGYEATGTGPRLGWDFAVGDALTVGMFGGITLTEIDPDRGNDAEAEHDAYTIGAFLAYEHPVGLDAHLMIVGGIDDYETRRPIRFGTVDRTAVSDHDGYHVGVRLGGRYLFSLGALDIGPTVDVDYLHQDQDGFAERSAGAFGLAVGGREVDSLETGLGLVLRHTDDVWVPELRARWVREWLDDDRTLSAALLGGPRFSVTTDDPERDLAVLGLGLHGRLESWLSIGLDYDATLGDDVERHAVRGAIEIRF